MVPALATFQTYWFDQVLKSPSMSVDRYQLVPDRLLANSRCQRIPGSMGNSWIYNVCGLDTVECELPEGQVFRVGSDDSGALLAAIVLR